MTRKDYEKIAVALLQARIDVQTSYVVGASSAVRNTAEHIADMLAADNPRFDRARFLKACGLEE